MSLRVVAVLCLITRLDSAALRKIKGLGDLNHRVLSNIHCDTYLYYYDSINFWLDVVPTKNIFCV